MAGGARLGIDTGGTFTDIVLVKDDGSISVNKVDNAERTIEANILKGAFDLAARAGVRPGAVAQVVHCTTVLGNAVVQRRGPRCGLITTKGFRDVLELKRQRNPVLYDVFWNKPPPLVPRRLVREATERIGADGGIVEPLDLEEARRVVARLFADGVTSVAVVFINACVNGIHERRVGELIRAEFPTLAVSLSCEVSPEWSEYERTSTTVTNAFVKPILGDYLGSLARGFRARGIAAPLDVMQSSGGVLAAADAIRRAVLCLDSGPAAGVVATCALGRFLGVRDAVTLEMGGTTTKCALIEKGIAARVNETEIGTVVSVGGRTLKGAGYALRIPIIDTAEVGAGGGSVASVDAGGSLAVGPEGAGAVPGPACYGRGGDRATVTDANLVLGTLDESHPLGGEIRLDRGRAVRALEQRIARPLGLSVEAAAYAVRAVANAQLARAIRAVSVERGRDVRAHALFAFGGGGPGHAADVARALGIRKVIVPPVPGLFSALGLLWSSLERHHARAAKVILEEPRAARRLAALFRDLAREARAEAGTRASGLRFRLSADLHYVGQFHELNVPVRDGLASAGALRRLSRAFEAEHRRAYGYHSPEERVEATSVRVVAYREQAATHARAVRNGLEKLTLDLYRPRGGGETRTVHFGPPFGRRAVPVLARGDLGARAVIGPVLLPEYDTTVVVPPDFRVRREPTGSLVLEYAGKAKPTGRRK